MSEPKPGAAEARSYHNRMMNIRDHRPTGLNEMGWLQYRTGHRDARHAAAEIALEADAQITTLTAENAALTEALEHKIEIAPDDLLATMLARAQKAEAQLAEANKFIFEAGAAHAALKAEVEEARRTSEYWKAERNACLADAEKAEAERDRLRAALERSEARANRFRKALDDLLRLKGFDASKLKEILAALAPGGGRGGEG